MIQWIQNLVESFQSAFQSVADLIQSVILGFQQFFSFLRSAIDFVSTALKLVPTVYYIFGVITITILIVLVITGRNAGGD